MHNARETPRENVHIYIALFCAYISYTPQTVAKPARLFSPAMLFICSAYFICTAYKQPY